MNRHIGHPRLDPAIAVELTRRERDALMTVEDWGLMLDQFFAQSDLMPETAGDCYPFELTHMENW